MHARVHAQFDGRSLVVDHAEARVGRHGSLRAHGRLPLHPNSPIPHPAGIGQEHQQADVLSSSSADSNAGGGGPEGEGGSSRGSGLVVDLGHLDLRVSNLYAGERGGATRVHVRVCGARACFAVASAVL